MSNLCIAFGSRKERVVLQYLSVLHRRPFEECRLNFPILASSKTFAILDAIAILKLVWTGFIWCRLLRKQFGLCSQCFEPSFVFLDFSLLSFLHHELDYFWSQQCETSGGGSLASETGNN